MLFLSQTLSYNFNEIYSFMIYKYIYSEIWNSVGVRDSKQFKICHLSFSLKMSMKLYLFLQWYSILNFVAADFPKINI